MSSNEIDSIAAESSKAISSVAQSINLLFPGIRRSSLRRAESKDYACGIADLNHVLTESGISKEIIDVIILSYTIKTKHLDNLAEVLELASTTHLGGKPTPDNTKLPESDWCDLFTEKASHAYDEKAKMMWAKLLAEEINQPGLFSKRTLRVLGDLSSDEAKLFEQLCAWSVELPTPEGTWLPIPLLATNSEEKYAGGLSWHDVASLEDAGLVTQSSAHGLIAHLEPKAEGKIQVNGHVIMITNHFAYAVEFRPDCSFTKTGCELLTLCDIGVAPVNWAELIESRMTPWRAAQMQTLH
ncbi:DUF2806 domain-containing protein [Bifidobacterium felsineum]|uniref:DUF2806 domain-containing protein n=1 Tax=Bifidobacterium felsineum TaxID=2045440 RepID=A0A2M9HIG6_9BIFI|nr:DUF2806 domain-containing protein [Bifidobacterium felsineum]PJM76620.1 hypothetical protein CSQ86_07810 [Bifidobacterium felsineum]